MRILMEEPEGSERLGAASHRLLQAVEDAGFDATVVTATGMHDMETPFIRIKPAEVRDDEQ